MKRHCVVVGDVMMDVSAVIDADIAYASDTPASISLVPGGAAANTASWMALNGHDVTLVGCVGADPFGRALKPLLRDAGVRLALREGRLATGACIVLVDRHRERTMLPDHGANGELTLADVDPHLTADSHLHMSGYTLLNPQTQEVALEACALARARGATISLDPASAAPLAQQRDLVRDLLPRIDLLLANEDEARVLSGQATAEAALRELRNRTPVVVIKLGGDGVLAADSVATLQLPARPVYCTDTTGAGDAFAAGFLPAWLEGAGLQASLDRGQEVASRCVSRVGASPLHP